MAVQPSERGRAWQRVTKLSAVGAGTSLGLEGFLANSAPLFSIGLTYVGIGLVVVTLLAHERAIAQRHTTHNSNQTTS